MLKEPYSLKIEKEALKRIEGLLADVPFLLVEHVKRHVVDPVHVREADFIFEVKANGRKQRLICEVKSNGQPRIVRGAIDQLRYFLSPKQNDAYGVVIAPYLSPAAQQICRNENIGFLDFEGNCRLVFNGVFIERAVPLRPTTERREIKSIYAPKSAQVLRLLLRDPYRHWRVVDLAGEAGVSLGHVSNVRSALIDREWGRADREGLVLSNPDALLDDWREVYTPPLGEQPRFYTTLHGSLLQQRLPIVLQHANRSGKATLASFSAAQWLAPYGRVNTHHFYADNHGLNVIRKELDLTSPSRGENVIITEIEDEGFFRDSVEPAPHIRCTSPVQTYLDLYIAGERGREAAQHLREEKLRWHSK